MRFITTLSSVEFAPLRGVWSVVCVWGEDAEKRNGVRGVRISGLGHSLQPVALLSLGKTFYSNGKRGWVTIFYQKRQKGGDK